MIRTVLALVLALGIAGPAAARPAHPLDAALRDVRAMVAASPDPWGLAVAVTDRTTTRLVATHGLADIDRRVPVTADTRFAIGSISKSFAALALMQLADAGRFDPAAPISRYLPEFAPTSPFPPITGQSLLTHTAGLPDYLANVASMQAEIAALNALVPGYAPGAHFWYSNSGYQLLGYVAERIAGMPYPLILQRRMLDRLGMTASAPQVDERLREAMARSYAPGADGRWHAGPWFPYLAADGAIVSTAPDMARYARMLLARGATPRGRLVSAAAFDRFATPALEQYGYGVIVSDGGRVLAHSGSIAGFQAYLHADTGRGWGVVLLSNGPLDRALRDRIIARLAVASGGAAPAAAKPLPAFAAAASFAGRFMGAGGAILDFAAQGTAGLALDEGGARTPLTRLGRDLWGAYLTQRGPRTFIFFRDAAQAIAGVSEGASSYAPGAPPSPAPAAWQAFAGRYMAHGEEGPGLRIFAHGAQLMMAYADSNAPPIALREEGPARFRYAEPAWAPERLAFDTIGAGKAQRLLLNGVPLYRIDLP